MIAIVIPYYKISFFTATLAALAAQTNQNFTVYIGNDASPECPEAIINRYKTVLDIKYVYFEKNVGGTNLTEQWHRCLDLITDEEWVMFNCDDDVLSENCVAEFYKNLQEINENNINVIRFSTDLIDDSGTKFNKIVKHPKIENAIDFFIRRQSGGTRNSLSENIFKKEIVTSVKFKNFPLAWHSDDLALLEFSDFGNLFTINNAIVYFRLSEINITNKKNNIFEKSEASFQFFHYLLNKHGDKFSLENKGIIQEKLEKNILHDKKNIKKWFLLSELYFRDLKIKHFFNLLSRIPKSIKKNNTF